MDFRWVALCSVLVWAASSPAWADRDDRGLSLSGAFASYLIEDQGAPGIALGLEYDHALTNSLWLRGQLGAAKHFGDGDTTSGAAVVSLAVTLDVVRYVPYVELGAGATLFTGSDRFDTKVKPVIRVGVGLDILHNRRISTGFFARLDSFASQSALFTTGLRGTYRWGYF